MLGLDWHNPVLEQACSCFILLVTRIVALMLICHLIEWGESAMCAAVFQPVRYTYDV